MSLLSGLLGRFRKRQSEVEVKLLHEDERKRTLVATREIPMQARVARDVPDELVIRFQRICEHNPAIQACLLLDTREPNAGHDNVKLLVRLVVNDKSQSGRIADQFLDVLKSFPPQFDRAYLSFNIEAGDHFMASAIYRRTGAAHVCNPGT